VPATVFVSSGFVGVDREFWWDEVERITLSPGSLPEHITLAAGDATFSATLDAQREYSTADADRDATWSVLADPSADGTRQRLYRELCAFLRPLPATARETALDKLRAQAGVSAAARPDNRPLTAEEVERLGASEMVAVGGHTVDHVVLSAQDAAEEQRQIALDRVGLASMLGTSPTMFSYPFGGLDDYSARTVDAVRQAGYAGACSNHPGVVKPWTDPYRIPRVLVRDWTADELHDTLEGWFRDPR
jgi:peptidoglycan/xylan/chitin deacetylase (PgdA/CDA1 family)